MDDDDRGVDDDELRRGLCDLLAERPRTFGELAEAAVDAGLIEADDEVDRPVDLVEDVLSTTDEVWVTSDDLVVATPPFIDDGMTFTHRLSVDEITAGAVALTPDLSVLDLNADQGLALRGGGTVRVDTGWPDGDITLQGPEGWLDDFAPGDLVAFRRSDHQLALDAVAAPADGAAEASALARAAEGWILGGRGEEEPPLVLEALARDPGLFHQAVPPVGELLAAAGLEQRGHEWGWAHEDWRTDQEVLADDDRGLRRRYGFASCCDAAYDRVLAAWSDWLRHDVSPDSAAVGRDLGHADVARAFMERDHLAIPVMVDFARVVAEPGGHVVASAHALAGLAHRRLADVEAAEASFQQALRLDPDQPVAAGELAMLVADRGDLGRAHALATRDDLYPERADWIADQRDQQEALRPRAGRNQACPCGSGRKFKHCCADGRLSLDQRVPLVLSRMVRFAEAPEHHLRRVGLAASAADPDAPDLVASIRGFLDDDFLRDVVVHEGGLGAAYLDERGPLLAGDEADFLAGVLEAPRRLWEILEVVDGEAMTLRDTRTGEVIEVSEHQGSRGRSPGELVLARATPVDGRQVLIGVPLVVSLRERDQVLDLLDDLVDADEVAMWYGSRFRAPTMTNREGETIAPRRTVLTVDDPAGATAALDRELVREGDGPVWHETARVANGDEVIRGVVLLEGGELVVRCNSEERQERLVDLVLSTVRATVIEEADDSDDVDVDLTANGDLADGLMGSDDLDGEARAALEDYIASYEQRWVDDPIPALGGLTPRQALDDPTRREDLLALLREMRQTAAPPGTATMSADRVEAILGIGRS